MGRKDKSSVSEIETKDNIENIQTNCDVSNFSHKLMIGSASPTRSNAAMKQNGLNNIDEASTPRTEASTPSHGESIPSFSIEHRVSESPKNGKSNDSGFGSRFIKLLLKKEGKAMVMISLYSVLATVGGSLAYNRYSSLTKSIQLSPVLKDFEGEVDNFIAENDRLEFQVEKLRQKVSNLTAEVQLLQKENDVFENLNNDLKRNVTLFHKIQQDLTEQNEQLNLMNTQMNESNIKFENLIDELNDENQDFVQSNNELHFQNAKLSIEVDTLHLINENLTESVSMFSEQNDRLETQVTNLREQNFMLNETIDSLNESNIDLSDQVSHFKSLNKDLMATVGFLDTTANDIDESLDDIISFLGSLIENYRSLALRDLEIEHQTKLNNWSCELQIFFGNENFVTDPNSPLGNSYSVVADFLNRRVLSELCVDIEDFEKFLSDKVGLKNKQKISLMEVLDALELYAALLHDFYFPDGTSSSNISITVDEWEIANFHCDQLQSNFIYETFSSSKT